MSLAAPCRAALCFYPPPSLPPARPMTLQLSLMPLHRPGLWPLQCAPAPQPWMPCESWRLRCRALLYPHSPSPLPSFPRATSSSLLRPLRPSPSPQIPSLSHWALPPAQSTTFTLLEPLQASPLPFTLPCAHRLPQTVRTSSFPWPSPQPIAQTTPPLTSPPQSKPCTPPSFPATTPRCWALAPHHRSSLLAWPWWVFPIPRPFWKEQPNPSPPRTHRGCDSRRPAPPRTMRLLSSALW